MATDAAQAGDGRDVLDNDEAVGNNMFYAGTTLPERSEDASLRQRQRDQRPIPPDSLTWKYFTDNRTNLMTLRLIILEMMWPQLGQGTSDHSQVFGKADGDFVARSERTSKLISAIVYGTVEDAKKRGIQVRNFHKSIKGAMPNHRSYHAIDAETFYFTHATFFEKMLIAGDYLFRKPLSRAEKEQIFEESKDWYSLYGVDDSPQPATYDEFEAYWADALENHLVDSKMAQYSVGFVKKKVNFPAPPNIPPLVRRTIWPLFSEMLRLTAVGPLPATIRDRLDVPWTARDQRRFERFCAVVRWLGPAFERLPLKYRYTGMAAEGFEREGIDPNDITLESARAALRRSRAEHAARVAETQDTSA